MLVGETQNSICEIPPSSYQFIIVALLKFSPGPIAIFGFGHIYRQIKAHRVGAIALHHVQPPNSPVSAAGNLVAFQIHKLIRGDVKGQIEPLATVIREKPAHTGQLGRPYHRVEGDVVFSDEIVAARLRVVPPILPCRRCASVLCPFNGGRQIPDDRLKPHVKAFALPAIERHRDAPVEIARNRAAMQPGLFHRVARRFDYIWTPVLLISCQICAQLWGKFGKVKKKMLSIAQLQREVAGLGTRFNQLRTVEHASASIALVTARVLVPTQIAGALHVAVRKKTPLLG